MAQDFALLDAVHQQVATNFDNLDSNMVVKSDATRMERMGDDKLMVKFYSRSVKDDAKSKEANRAIFEEQTYINIKLPGDKNNDVNRVAFPEDIVRFPVHYERYRKNQDQVIGTPLSAVGFLTEPQVEEYKTLFIRTVEQLAGLPDVTCQKIMGSVTHKQQAQAFLDSFKSADTLRAEFQKKFEEQAAQIAELQAKSQPQVPQVKKG
jgi:hypothetical protein